MPNPNPKSAPPSQTAEPAKLNPWQKLMLYVGRRHDYFEAEYIANNFSADEAKMAFYREIYEVMKNLQEDAAKQSQKKG